MVIRLTARLLFGRDKLPIEHQENGRHRRGGEIRPVPGSNLEEARTETSVNAQEMHANGNTDKDARTSDETAVFVPGLWSKEQSRLDAIGRRLPERGPSAMRGMLEGIPTSVDRKLRI